VRRALALLLSLGTLSLGTLSLGTLSLGTACTPAPQDTTTVLGIGGMVCESCSQAITAALGKRDGVHEVTVDHVTGEAVVRHDAARIDRAALVAAVTALGYTVAP
jgi:copper chaperone CopZ